jgi:hypothetical protein
MRGGGSLMRDMEARTWQRDPRRLADCQPEELRAARKPQRHVTLALAHSRPRGTVGVRLRGLH